HLRYSFQHFVPIQSPQKKRPAKGPTVCESLNSRLGKRAVNASFAEPRPTHDLGHGKPLRSQLLDFLHDLSRQDRLGTEPHPLSLGLVDAVLLALSADIVLEFCNQGEDAHDQL